MHGWTMASRLAHRLNMTEDMDSYVIHIDQYQMWVLLLLEINK